jgi:hypothetical protein
MTLLRAVAPGCICFAVILSACGGDPTARLGSAIDDLCELSDECHDAHDEQCVEIYWRVAALSQQLWGDRCVDSFVAGLECLVEERVCDPSSPEWWCENIDGLESCAPRLPCHAEQLAMQAVCGST